MSITGWRKEGVKDPAVLCRGKYERRVGGARGLDSNPVQAINEKFWKGIVGEIGRGRKPFLIGALSRNLRSRQVEKKSCIRVVGKRMSEGSHPGEAL